MQKSGRMVSMNDLDCCLVAIHEKKVKNDSNCNKILHLPFSDITVNLYNFTIVNKKQEIRLIKKSEILGNLCRLRPLESPKAQGQLEPICFERIKSNYSSKCTELSAFTMPIEAESNNNMEQYFANNWLEYGNLWSQKIKNNNLALPTPEEMLLGLYQWLCHQLKEYKNKFEKGDEQIALINNFKNFKTIIDEIKNAI